MALFAEMEQNVSALSQNVYFSFHVNNSMLECLLGSKISRNGWHSRSQQSRFIVKQDLDLPGLYLRQEPSVENSWYVSRMMVFSVSIIMRQSKSQDDREIGKRFAPLWNALSKMKSYKNSSLKVILKVLSLCPLSMFEHKSSTFTIAETVLENMCSNLHHRDTTKCSLSLLLVCVSLTANVWWPPLPLLAFPPLGESRSLLFLRRYALVVFSSCGLSVQMYGPSWPSAV